MTIADYYTALFVAFLLSVAIGFITGALLSSTNKTLF